MLFSTGSLGLCCLGWEVSMRLRDLQAERNMGETKDQGERRCRAKKMNESPLIQPLMLSLGFLVDPHGIC